MRSEAWVSIVSCSRIFFISFVLRSFVRARRPVSRARPGSK